MIIQAQKHDKLRKFSHHQSTVWWWCHGVKATPVTELSQGAAEDRPRVVEGRRPAPWCHPKPCETPNLLLSTPRWGWASQHHAGGTVGPCPSSALWLYHSHASFQIQLKCKIFVSFSNATSLPVTASVQELRESIKKFRGPSRVNLNCQRSV